MPELPEVETVRRFLELVLLGTKSKKIKSVKALYPGMIKGVEPSVFIKHVVGQSFTSVDRYGKHLLLKLNDYCIISHLRMEGKYHYESKGYEP